MFATQPHFQQQLPPNIGVPDECYWLAVALTSASTFYLVTSRLRVEGGWHSRTTFIAWESTLREMAEAVGSSFVRAYMMVPEANGAWGMQRITQIWAPGQVEADATGPALFGLLDTPGLLDSLRRPLTAANKGRRLLAKLDS